jgi:octopine/nopaline transport system substrate-binding protein
MRNISTWAAALIGTALASGALATGALAQAKTWSSIKIATEGAYAPYNFMGPGGKLDGFEVELAYKLCERMKAKCEVVQQDWDGIVPALQAGKYDAIMAGMNVTEKRKEVVDFSTPYVREMNGFVVAKDGPLAKLADDGVRVDLTGDTPEAKKVIDELKPLLKGKAVGVQVSTIHANFMDRYFKDTIDVREYKTTEQHDLDLAAGRIDAHHPREARLQGLRDQGPEIHRRRVRDRGRGRHAQERARVEEAVRRRDRVRQGRRNFESLVGEVVQGRRHAAGLSGGLPRAVSLAAASDACALEQRCHRRAGPGDPGKVERVAFSGRDGRDMPGHDKCCWALPFRASLSGRGVSVGGEIRLRGRLPE